MSTDIECRYQWRGPNGIEWTKWFVFRRYKSNELAKKDFKRVSEMKNFNKLKVEYRIGNDF